MVSLLTFERLLRYSFKAIGLVGNILMFAVYNQVNMRRLSSSIYFRFVAIVFIGKVVNYFLVSENWQKTAYISQTVYKLLNYTLRLFLAIMAWLQVAASFDRLVIISFPTRLAFLRRPFTQRLIVAMIFLYNMIFYSSALLKFKIIRTAEPINNENIENNRKFIRIFTSFDLINSSGAPFIALFILSLGIFVGILRARRHRRFIKSTGRDSTVQTRRILKDMKFGLTLIVLNMFFLIFFGLYRVYNIFDDDPYGLFSAYYTPFKMIYGSILYDLADYYFSIIFYIQLVVNSFVRKESHRFFARIWNSVRQLHVKIIFFTRRSSSLPILSTLPCDATTVGIQ